MKKSLLLLIIAFAGFNVFAKKTPYTLPLPEKWTKEKLSIPIEFAPSIPYKGTEELRFTPGWGNAGSNDYWSYTYLWFIEGIPKVNADTLQSYMTAYFDGLFRSNDKTKSPEAVSSFTKSVVKKAATAPGDQATYAGKISTLNFLNASKIEFYIRIHLRNYPNSNHSAILFELSPKPYDNVVWQGLDAVVSGFKYR
jgi:hypothetical protein